MPRRFYAPFGRPFVVSAAAMVVACGMAVSCAKQATWASADKNAAAPGAVAQCDLNNPANTAGTKTAPTPPAEADHHAVHNIRHIGTKMISGGVPEGDAGFDELKALGVKTIISVDGATPDLAKAQARGMRYVHIPITYATATPEQQLELARAVRDLPGPVFIHCHHGKHRSPAAAASVAVLLGEKTPEEAVAFMKEAGTAPTYTGLYQCVATAQVASAVALDAAPAEFPPVRKPEGIVAAMVEVDLAYEHLGLIRAAGWTTPKDHPDLVPAAEAGRLADQLRFSGEDHKAKGKGAEYAKQLASAIEHATALETMLAKSPTPPAAEIEVPWKLVAASCKDCHAKHRDTLSW